MPRTLFLYVFFRSLRSLLVALLVVTSIIMLVDFVEANRDLSADIDVRSFQLFALTILKTPTLMEQTIPFVVLFGMLGAINDLNRRSELIVMRASGQSAWSIIRPALWLAAAVGVAWALVFNPLASYMYDKFEVQSATWLGAEPKIFENDIWLRGGRVGQQTVIRAAIVDLASQTINDATFFLMDVQTDGQTNFTRRFDAQSAQLITQGYWQLTNVIENAPGEAMQRHDAISLPTSIDIETLRQQADRNSRAGFWSMPKTIRDNESVGFSARELRLRFNRLLSLPVMLIAMTFIAAGVSMSLTREGGTLKLLITGAALGFAVFFADSMVGAFGEVAVVPIYMAAWFVPLIVLLLGISHMAKIEDG